MRTLLSVAAAAVVGGCPGDEQTGRTAVADRQPGSCSAPYSATSPWNTPVGPAPAYHRRSSEYVAELGTRLSSDPTQYTYPVYEVSSVTPRVDVHVEGRYSDVTDGGRRLHITKGTTVRLPIPADAEPARGSDSQVIILDPETGDEWGAWRLERRRDGSWEAVNAYHYNTDWDGVPPQTEDGKPFVSRGAGVPYLAGLVRPCELRQGRIDHALAFAYDYPSDRHVYPATKSDGNGDPDRDLPEGARLQLDPTISEAQIEAWGCTGLCLVMARALQRYGMYVIDNSGRPKVMLEYDGTARWDGIVDARTVAPIPLSSFKVVVSCTRVGTNGPDQIVGTLRRDVICGRGGADVIHGRAGDDVLYGGAGRDRLVGGSGADRLYGEGGADRLLGGRAFDVLVGGSGGDRLLSRDDGKDLLVGRTAHDHAVTDGAVDRRVTPAG